MENQHRKIKGYRELNETEIGLMNEIKQKGEELEELLEKITRHIVEDTLTELADKNKERERITAKSEAQPSRWVSIAKTDLQTGLMALTRAIAQPTNF